MERLEVRDRNQVRREVSKLTISSCGADACVKGGLDGMYILCEGHVTDLFNLFSCCVAAKKPSAQGECGRTEDLCSIEKLAQAS